MQKHVEMKLVYLRRLMEQIKTAKNCLFRIEVNKLPKFLVLLNIP